MIRAEFYLSLILIFLSIMMVKRVGLGKYSKIIYSVSLFSLINYLCFYIVANYLSGDGINEAVIYHLRYGMEGAGFGDFLSVIFASVGLLVFNLVLVFWINKSIKITNPSKIKLAGIFFFLLFILRANPGTIQLYHVINSEISAVNYIYLSNKSQLSDDNSDFKEYYQLPNLEHHVKSKNLVFIYAESLERTYFDEKIFPGLTTDLKEIESQAISFTNIEQGLATGWTIAGFTGSLCGIPLFTTSHGNAMVGMDGFLTGANCMGDLLKASGYHLEFMGGADLKFAGKGKFFKSHGFDSVLGGENLLFYQDDRSYTSNWGVYDDSLFKIAFNRFQKKSNSNDKFGLFLLTLDTHHPDGHIPKSCSDIKYQSGENPMLNAVKCSDKLISNFIRKIMVSPHASDTLIVLAADHLAMRNSAYNDLKKGNRKLTFMIFDPSIESGEKIQKKGTTFDIGATVLSRLGNNTKLGLGRNLLSEEKSLAEQFKGNQRLSEKIGTWRNSILSFWDFPTIQKKITIMKNKVSIDERHFKTPILIEIPSTFKTKFRFNHEHRSLVSQMREIPKSSAFVWVQKCKDMKIKLETDKDDFCLSYGKKSKKDSIVTAQITDKYTLDRKELERIINN